MKRWLKNRLQGIFGILLVQESLVKIINSLESLNSKLDNLEQKNKSLSLEEKIQEISQNYANKEDLSQIISSLESLNSQIHKLEQKDILPLLEEISGNSDKSTKLINQVVDVVLQKNHSSIFWGDRLLSLDKTMGFWEDPKFKEAQAQIIGSHQYDQYNQPAGIAWRLHTLVWAAKNAVNLPGDFVECGVFKGDMSWVISQCLDFDKVDKTFYLYDTFDGFSPKYSSAEDFPDNSRLFEIADKIYKDPSIYKYVESRFSSYSNIKVIKGVLPDTLAEESPNQIAFLHIDLNSPAPEIGVLNALFDRIVSGGIIVFDDYGWLPFKKQKIAEDEWMAQRGYSILELPTGQGLVIKQ